VYEALDAAVAFELDRFTGEYEPRPEIRLSIARLELATGRSSARLIVAATNRLIAGLRIDRYNRGFPGRTLAGEGEASHTFSIGERSWPSCATWG
jgi:hypothetical protein